MAHFILYLNCTGTTNSLVGDQFNTPCHHGSSSSSESIEWRSTKSLHGTSPPTTHVISLTSNVCILGRSNFVFFGRRRRRQIQPQMFGRILELQQKEYGIHDPRCYMTLDKIKIVQRRGTNFEQAVEELRKTFSIPDDNEEEDHAKLSSTTSSGSGSGKRSTYQPLMATGSSGGCSQSEQSMQKTKTQKNKMMKVITSIRKKKPTTPSR